MNSVEKNRTFLTEIIIVILFFSISAVVLVNVFAKADEKSREGKLLTEFSIMTRSLEAQLTGDFGDGIENNVIGDIVNQIIISNGFVNKGEAVFVKYLDKELNKADLENGVYKVTVVAAVDNSNEFSSIVSYELRYTDIEENKEYYSVSFNKLVLGKEE